MMTYHYNCERSNLPEHQVPGLTCEAFIMGGQLQASSAADAWKVVVGLCVIPGHYVITMRKGRRWLKPWEIEVALVHKGQLK